MISGFPITEGDRSLEANALLDAKVLPHEGLLSEDLTKELFALYDVPEPRMMLAQSEKDLERLLEEVGTPVVLKISSPEIMHKKDVGGIQRNIRTLYQAKKAYAEILKHAEEHANIAGIRGVIVQKHIESEKEFSLHLSRKGQYVIVKGNTGEDSIQTVLLSLTALMNDVPDIADIWIDPAVFDGSSLQILDAKVILKRSHYIDAD
jgi:succinyl-CoA synthetase beta subunit